VKKIDVLLMKSFVAPFIATFCIGLFVLIMQFLWVYIDDIIGKGTGFLVMVELLGYKSMSLVPMALPIAVLISSVMVMGNMAEHYELASLKSAGVPLLRVMAPLILMSFGIMIFSFLCSNYIIPAANLKFKSRLYDIKRQKPMLSLQTGVFNEDFRNMVIHIGGKDEDNRTIHDVLIYDHNSYNNKKVSVITANKGEMFTTADQRFFVMNLYNGTQYQETKITPDRKDGKTTKNYPFVRTSFKEWTKVFDLSEFDMRTSDTEMWKNSYTMLSAAQLATAIDSIDAELDRRWNKNYNLIYRNFHIFKDSVIVMSLPEVNGPLGTSDMIKKSQNSNVQNAANKKQFKTNTPSNSPQKKPKINTRPKHKKITSTLPKRAPADSLALAPTYLETFEIGEHASFNRRISSTLHSIANESQSSQISIDSKMESRVKHIFERYNKYSMAVVCMIFLFIGAPMGAIIRKGGFGYPILVAIFFFVFYIIMGIFFKKVAESHTLSAVLAAWMPCVILFPMGIVLTIRAMNDSKLVNFENLRQRMEDLRQFISRKKHDSKPIY